MSATDLHVLRETTTKILERHGLYPNMHLKGVLVGLTQKNWNYPLFPVQDTDNFGWQKFLDIGGIPSIKKLEEWDIATRHPVYKCINLVHFLVGKTIWRAHESTRNVVTDCAVCLRVDRKWIKMNIPFVTRSSPVHADMSVDEMRGIAAFCIALFLLAGLKMSRYSEDRGEDGYAEVEFTWIKDPCLGVVCAGSNVFPRVYDVKKAPSNPNILNEPLFA